MSLCWLRKGLRLHDNLSLLAASKEASEKKTFLMVLFLLDKNLVNLASPNRLRFLHESLIDIEQSLKKKSQRLVVVNVDDFVDSRVKEPSHRAAHALKGVVDKFKIKSVHFELCDEPYGKLRDSEVVKLCKQDNVAFKRWSGATLVDPRDLARLSPTGAPISYGSFIKLFERAGGAQEALPEPKQLAKKCDAIADDLYRVKDVATPILLGSVGTSHSPTSNSAVSSSTTTSADNKRKRSDQTVTSHEPVVRGGESEALRLMNEKLSDEKWVSSFEKPKTSPFAVEQASTTMLSPYLKFGCLSPRLFFARLRAIEQKHTQHTAPPVSLVGQLLWREHFMQVAAAVGDTYARIQGNPVCRQIKWEEDETALQRWRQGKTGFPLVDAVMRQLVQEGWIHHLARHLVACFATRGDLYLPWPQTAAVFDYHLLDADHALNNSNWMWLSASAFFHQYGRVYSPIAFGKKYKEAPAYIRKYVPELQNIPDKYIFEPYNAPDSVQKSSNCIIGTDYPTPIVDHATARKQNLEKMSQAYGDASKKSMYSSNVPYKHKYTDDADTDAQRNALKQYASQ